MRKQTFLLVLIFLSARWAADIIDRVFGAVVVKARALVTANCRKSLLVLVMGLSLSAASCDLLQLPPSTATLTATETRSVLNASTVPSTPTRAPSNTPTFTRTSTRTPLPTETPTATANPLPTLFLPAQAVSAQNLSQLGILAEWGREFPGKSDQFFVGFSAFTPDGKMLVMSDYKNDYRNGKVYLWDTLTGQMVASFAHSFTISRVAISADGKLIATVSDSSMGIEGTVRVWNTLSGEELHAIRAAQSAGVGVDAIAFSPNDKLLAIGSGYATVTLWDLSNGRELKTLSGSGDSILGSIAFSPDGELLAASAGSTVTVWRISSGEELYTTSIRFRWGEGLPGVTGVVFSSDSRLLAAINRDNIAAVWDVATGLEINSFVGPATILRMNAGGLAFTPDGKMLVTGNDSGGITFWEVETGKALHDIGECMPNRLAFWPDGKVLVCVCQNGVIQLWGSRGEPVR